MMVERLKDLNQQEEDDEEKKGNELNYFYDVINISGYASEMNCCDPFACSVLEGIHIGSII